MADDKTRVYVRLSTDAYEALEKQCNPPHVANESSATQIAFTLGQQSVLNKLRKGFVIGA